MGFGGGKTTNRTKRFCSLFSNLRRIERDKVDMCGLLYLNMVDSIKECDIETLSKLYYSTIREDSLPMHITS